MTERAAVSAARLRGHGKDKASDQAAVDAMRRELNKLPIDGTVVIGEGELDEAPMLFIGEKVGNKSGPKVDIAVDPLEGTTLCAKNMPGAIATLAMAEAGTLLHAPDCLHGQDRDRAGLSQGHDRSRRAGRREHPPSRQGQGREARRDHRDPARPAAACRHHRGGAQDRRRGEPDHRRRRRRRDPLRRAQDRHRHLSRHRRRAGRRAGGGGAALHRRPDADAGSCSTPRSGASAR